MLRNIFLLLGLGIGLWSCEPYSTEDLAGSWTAYSMTEEGTELAIDPADLGFVFDANGRYHFKGTLNYTEAGTFRLDGPYLYSTDTVHTPVVEKAVEIKLLNTDTLHLRMMENDKERMMKLVKQ